MVSPGDDDYDHVSHDRGQVCQQVHQEEEVPQVLEAGNASQMNSWMLVSFFTSVFISVSLFFIILCLICESGNTITEE